MHSIQYKCTRENFKDFQPVYFKGSFWVEILKLDGPVTYSLYPVHVPRLLLCFSKVQDHFLRLFVVHQTYCVYHMEYSSFPTVMTSSRYTNNIFLLENVEGG